MHVLTKGEIDDESDRGVIEELSLPPHLRSWLAAAARASNPLMPAAFGVPAMIRVLVDLIDDSEIDLSAATGEADIVRLVTDAVRHRRKGPSASGQPSSSGCSEPRRSSRSNPPARGRYRSGTRPRSSRG